MDNYKPTQHGQYALTLWLATGLLFIACGKPPPEPPPKPLYPSDTVIRIQSSEYIYLARVTADTLPTAKAVPVFFFTPHLQRKLGDTIDIGDVLEIREEPENGWGTQLVGAEYFDGVKWHFAWEIREMADHYLLPETFQGVRRLEFSNIRFPVPAAR